MPGRSAKESGNILQIRGLRLKLDLRNPVLEAPKLWLCKEPSAPHVMTVLDASSQRLGLVREAARSWFAPRLLEVFELDDESLVFRLQRGLLSGWAVSDAEGQMVGRLSGWQANLLEDGGGRPVGSVQQLSAATTQIVAHDARELGRFEQSARGVELSFAADLTGEPFLKMLVLAATLVRLV